MSCYGMWHKIHCCQLEKNDVMPSWIQEMTKCRCDNPDTVYSTSQKIPWSSPSGNPHCSRALALLGRAVSTLSWPAQGHEHTHTHTKMSFWMLNYGNSLELPNLGVKNNNQSLDCIFCLHSASEHRASECLVILAPVVRWCARCVLHVSSGGVSAQRESVMTLWPCGFHL